MSRQARIVLPQYPHHIIQRGHNRQTVFAGEDDYLYYLDNLREWKTRLGCRLYAYCLMSNHVHLVLDPGENPENLGLLMKRLAGRQTRYINRVEDRSGSLWEGRYKSSPIQAEKYLLACCRYVELNPLRAGLVEDPAAYPWSSCAAKVGKAAEVWIDLDPIYLGMGKTPALRAARYGRWLRQSIPDGEWELIRTAIQRGHLAGTKKFVREISARLGRRLEQRGPGRPRKTGK